MAITNRTQPSSPSPINGEKEKYGRIPFSAVEVKKRPRTIFHKWNPKDMVYATMLVIQHTLCFLAPLHFTWGALRVACVLYTIQVLGINLCYHRYLSHQSFKLPKWLEYLFAYCGLLALQGTPISWVSTHRYHHKYTDKLQDPHSPIEGFWYSHAAWVFNQDYKLQKCGPDRNVEDLKKQWFYRFLERTHLIHPITLGILLYKYGGLPYLLWGMGVGVTFSHHASFVINSVCHIWGDRPWNTGDLSTNNRFLALYTFGESWHNNHHAFEFSARHGLEWWQIDIVWMVILMLEFVGLATDIKVPSELHKKKMSFNNDSEDVKY